MIQSLQSLRFAFCILIFSHHFYKGVIFESFGPLSVTFFFILSGFVMTIGYGKRVNVSSFSYKQYMVRRLVKIVPLNLFCLGLYLVLPVLSDICHQHISERVYVCLIPDILLIQSWIPIQSVYFSGNDVAWFLSDMVFFYLAFPFLVRIIEKSYGKLLMLMILAIYFIGIPYIGTDWMHAFIYIHPVFRLIDFMIGITLSLVLTKKVKGKHPYLATLFEIASVIIVIGAISMYSITIYTYKLASLFWIPVTLMIAAFYASSIWGGQVSRALNNHYLIYLGGLSFPVYMLHQILIRWCRMGANFISVPSESFVLALVSFMITCCFAYIYTERLEPKLLRGFKRRE